ncbi:trypsin-like [Convolutriloba macropyga]|uniref:trypsin-like n=1 Tax=Convolutriloba macropyga TaxID=536237 RepID=UPI003F51BB41
MTGYNIDNLTITYGDFTDKNSKRMITSVKSFKKHENFNIGAFLNDIAIIKTEARLPPTRKIRLCKTSYPEKTPLASCGLGLVSHSDVDSKPEVLIEATFRENKTGCRPQNICSTSRETYVCHGDSGGPLYVLGIGNKAECLYGLTSYGKDSIGGDLLCIGKNHFTNVPYYYDWIKQNSL